MMSETDNKDQAEEQAGETAAPEPTEAQPDATQQLAQKLDEAEKELLYQRAEFENFKKRIQREQDRTVKFSNEKIIGELLSVVDLLSRAMEHGSELADSDDKKVVNFVNGVQMTQKELEQTLSKFGVEFLGMVGDTFDPNKHEAISQLETEKKKENTVLAVHQRGCLLHGRMLKPAKVVVGKPSSKETSE